jgi:hypothetical protein
MRSLVLVILFLAGCGSAPSKSGADGAVDDQPTTTASAPTEHSLYVQTASELPPCDASKEGWIAYLNAVSQLQACADGQWSEIHVGSQGPAGEKGEPGEAGPAGEKGDPGEPGGQNQWIDPMTHKRWLIGGSGNLYFAMSACTNGWTLGSVSSLVDASAHGLYAAFAEAIDAAPVLACGDGSTAVKPGTNCPSQDPNTQFGIYCVWTLPHYP